MAGNSGAPDTATVPSRDSAERRAFNLAGLVHPAEFGWPTAAALTSAAQIINDQGDKIEHHEDWAKDFTGPDRDIPHSGTRSSGHVLRD